MLKRILKIETRDCNTEPAISTLARSACVTKLSTERGNLILLPQRLCHSESMVQCVKNVCH
jgi:hypothetical protein